MQDIQAVFLDIDGTMVSFETHRMAESTIRALDAARGKGVKLFVATGRPPKVINNLNNYPFDGLVSMNGSICYNHNEEPLFKSPLPNNDVKLVTDYMKRGAGISAIVITESDVYITNRDEIMNRTLELVEFPVLPDMSIDDVVNHDIYQLTVCFDEQQELEIMPQIPGCHHTRWHPDFIDINRKGNTKALGIDQIINHYNIPLEACMAIGDGGNDIEMLKHVGLGVAMGNAHDSVKSVADDVTRSVDDDGVWHAFMKHGLI